MGCVLGFPFEDQKELGTEAATLHPAAVVQHLSLAMPDREGFVPIGITLHLCDTDRAIVELPCQGKVDDVHPSQELGNSTDPGNALVDGLLVGAGAGAGDEVVSCRHLVAAAPAKLPDGSGIIIEINAMTAK